MIVSVEGGEVVGSPPLGSSLQVVEVSFVPAGEQDGCMRDIGVHRLLYAYVSLLYNLCFK